MSIYDIILSDLAKIPKTYVFNNSLYDEFGLRLFWRRDDAIFVRPGWRDEKGTYLFGLEVNLKEPNSLETIKSNLIEFMRERDDIQ